MVWHSTSRSFVLGAWLLALVLLCVSVFPTSAYAKYHRTIASEGDPMDGVESSGTTGGGTADPEEENNSLAGAFIIPQLGIGLTLYWVPTLNEFISQCGDEIKSTNVMIKEIQVDSP